MAGEEIHLTARVLPGGRIDVIAPGLHEGQDVDLVVRPRGNEHGTQRAGAKLGILDFLKSLPPSNRTPEQWDEFEREFQRERDAWDRDP